MIVYYGVLRIVVTDCSCSVNYYTEFKRNGNQLLGVVKEGQVLFDN